MKFINKYWYYFLLFIPFCIIIPYNLFPVTDTWFLLNTGRYIVNNGIFTIDPFSMHEGLTIIVQQWLSDVIFYGMYSLFGAKGLMILLIILLFLISYCTYKLFYFVCNNKVLAYVLMILCISVIGVNFLFVTRPQLFTYLFLVIELLLVEKYIKSKNVKYLYGLPILSLLLINLHSSMWMMLFVFLLPYIVNGINFKKFNKTKYSIKPILIVMVIMFLVGFINPYTYKNVFYLYYSYGFKEINLYIKEMQNPDFTLRHFRIWALLIGMMIFIINYYKQKLDSRHFLFIVGCSLLYLGHIKMFPYFAIVYFFSLCYLLKGIKIKIKDNILFYLGRVFICIIGIFGIPIMMYEGVKRIRLESYIQEIGDYLLDNCSNDIRVYNDFEYGGYIEYIGFKAFIDGRAELYYKRFNNKDDIFIDYYNVKSDFNYDIDSFIEKYDFTHFIVEEGSFLDYYLKINNYNIVYTMYVGEDEDKIPVYNLFEKEE